MFCGGNLTVRKKVSEHVILYLDILGYEDIIKSCEKRGKTEDDYLQEVDKLMSDLASHIDARNKETSEKTGLDLSSFRYRIFSDNIVFFAPIKDDDKLGIERSNLGINLLYGLSEFLFSYNKTELFFRGAITCGKLYYNHDIGLLFGTGLVKAYHLENEIAIFPRIVIDEPFRPDGLVIGIARGHDGIGFLDYLSLFAHPINVDIEVEEWRKHIRPYIQNFAQAISNAIKTYCEIPKIYQKYTYLAQYLNWFCNNNDFSEYTIPIETIIHTKTNS